MTPHFNLKNRGCIFGFLPAPSLICHYLRCDLSDLSQYLDPPPHQLLPLPLQHFDLLTDHEQLSLHLPVQVNQYFYAIRINLRIMSGHSSLELKMQRLSLTLIQKVVDQTLVCHSSLPVGVLFA